MGGVQNYMAYLTERLEAARAIVFVVFGLGFTRACLGWILTLTRSHGFSLALPLAPSYIVGIGEVVGFFAIALTTLRHVPVKDARGVFCFPLVAIPLGAVLSSLSVAFPGLPHLLAMSLFSLGCLSVSTGYAVLFLLWLEFLCILTPRKALLGFSLAYFANLVLWLTNTQVTLLLGTIVCIITGLLSCYLLTVAYRSAPTQPVLRLPPHGMTSRWLILWVSLFSLAIGLGDSITGLAYTTVFSKLGMGVTELIVLLCLWLLPGHFEMNVFYRMTLVLMLLGLMGAFFTSLPLGISQLALSASNESFWLFSLMVAVFVSRQRRTSGAFYCGLVLMASTLATRVGVIVGTALGEPSETFCMVALALVAALGLFLLRESQFDEQLHLNPCSEPDESVYRALAQDRNLSKRELAVYLLLVQGQTYDEVAEALFIAPSTVRAHASRIYEKFGTHTRQEFEHIVTAGLRGGLTV